MIGRTPPQIRVIQPLKNGVIADFEMTEKMLSYFIARTQRWLRTILKPRVVVGVPAGITQVERRAVRDSARHAGAREVHLVEEPVGRGARRRIAGPGAGRELDRRHRRRHHRGRGDLAGRRHLLHVGPGGR
jgi:actin-like ATPase involved in cell morphogenesis